MQQLSANPIRQLLTAVLAVSLVVCCCQAHFLLHGLSGELADATGAPASSACCSGCPDEAPSAPSNDAPSDTPTG
ncbi:MAG: hypothetical protein ACYTJ0_19390, partial [Planctomycetota bacterium]